jgi:hypothetical protein
LESLWAVFDGRHPTPRERGFLEAPSDPQALESTSSKPLGILSPISHFVDNNKF